MIDANNESGIQTDELSLVTLARFVLSRLRIHLQAGLSILLMDEATTTECHQRLVDLSSPTSMINFPVDESREPAGDEKPPLRLLGNIVLRPQVTVRQAAESGRGPVTEAEHLLIHDLSHLLGHDHAEPEEEAVMLGLNDKVITAWEVAHNNRRSDRPVND